MFDFSATVLGLIMTAITFILKIVIMPIDGLLSLVNVPDISGYIQPIFNMIGTTPHFVVYMLGVAPVLWNTSVLLTIVWLLVKPITAAVKFVIRIVIRG